MRRLLGLVLFAALVAFSFPTYAGHDFMAEMKKITFLFEERSCSNGLVKIEYRAGVMVEKKFFMVLVIFEPDAASKKSEFYRESNKDFYSLIFYGIFPDTDTSAEADTYYIKKAQSGDLKELPAFQWIEELFIADPNVVKSLMQQPGSDCVTVLSVQPR